VFYEYTPLAKCCWGVFSKTLTLTVVMMGPRRDFAETGMKDTASAGKGALAAHRKKLAAFSALGGGFLLFPIGDRRCNRTRASVGNAGGNARPSLTNATLAASRLLWKDLFDERSARD
jgi:hypothetical protein